MDRLRGETPPGDMYTAIRTDAREIFNSILGMPPVASGEPQTGQYSGKQANILITAAAKKAQMRNDELANALEEAAEKELALYRKYWYHPTYLDNGSKQSSAYISAEVLHSQAWGAEIFYDKAYQDILAQNNAEVASLWQMGAIDPQTFISRLSSLDEEEKARVFQWLTMQAMNALGMGAEGTQSSTSSTGAGRTGASRAALSAPAQ